MHKTYDDSPLLKSDILFTSILLITTSYVVNPRGKLLNDIFFLLSSNMDSKEQR